MTQMHEQDRVEEEEEEERASRNRKSWKQGGRVKGCRDGEGKAAAL